MIGLDTEDIAEDTAYPYPEMEILTNELPIPAIYNTLPDIPEESSNDTHESSEDTMSQNDASYG